MEKVKLRIYGKVQGVFFRKNCKEFCGGLGLKGFVRNLKDGSVEIVACGAGEDLRKLVEWAKESPEGSEVERVEVEWGECAEEFVGFKIR